MTTAGGIKKTRSKKKIKKIYKKKERKCGEINTIKSSRETSRLEEGLTEEEENVHSVGNVPSVALEVPS